MKLLGVYINHGFTSEARVFSGLLRHRGNNYDAYVLHHDYPGDRESATRFEEASGARIERVDVSRRQKGKLTVFQKAWHVFQFRLCWLKLLRYAQAYQPDVVYSSQQYWDCLAASFIARQLGVPHIVHLHYTIGPYLGKPILKRLKTCDHIVTVSDFIRKLVIDFGVPPERVTTVRNFMDVAPKVSEAERLAVREELGVTKDTPLIGMVARLAPDKGHDDTMRAFVNLGEYPTASGPTAPQLIIVGDGPEEDNLKKLAVELGVADRIKFLGRRSDVPRLMSAFNVFCHPSRYDPCPLALFEAAGSGLPIVAYDEGGAPEIIKQGETGLLAPPGDVLTLSRHLARLLNDPAEARRMGQAGYTRIEEHFKPENAGAAFTALLRKIVTPQSDNCVSSGVGSVPHPISRSK